MDNSLLVRMLHAFANLDEEFQTFTNTELLLIAIVRHGQAIDVLHGEVRLSSRGRTGVKDLGDSRMIHEGQRLTLRLEALHHGGVVEACPDEFESNTTPHRRSLLGQPNLSHTAYPKFFE